MGVTVGVVLQSLGDSLEVKMLKELGQLGPCGAIHGSISSTLGFWIEDSAIEVSSQSKLGFTQYDCFPK